LVADRVLRIAGYEHYGVSNFAMPAQRSRHNSGYWSGAPYVGLGPAAHGFDGACRRWNEPAYARWLARLREGQDPVEGGELLTDENRLSERVYLGLRTDQGLLVTDTERSVVERWVRAGWAELHGDRIRLTPSGW